MSFTTARAQSAPVRATSGAPKRLALILTWIAVALFASFATASVATAAPVVTEVSPNDGLATCCSQIVVTGSGFLDATEIDFGSGNPAQNFTVVSDSEIDVVTASGAVGTTVDITVTSPEGTSAISSADQYTFILVPTVSSISPTSGPQSGGTSVTITGTNFQDIVEVNFGNALAASYTVNSPTQITAVTAAASIPSSGQVVVYNDVGGSSQNVAFTFTGAPAVTSVSPSNGSSSGGTSVTIRGGGFTGATAVNFGATPATSFTVNNQGQITATAPAGSGVVNVTVTTSLGTSATSTSDEFSYAGAAPAISSINPTGGPTTGGTSVTIAGSGFTGATSVTFGSASASFTVNSATSITATSPAVSSTGNVDITVAGPTGASAHGFADRFDYVSPSPPSITSVSPSSGPIAGGTQVTITGANLSGVTSVNFGSASATLESVSSTAIVVASPSVASTGIVDITVSTPAATSATGPSDRFTYVANPPIVGQLNPSVGSTTGGTSVAISGTGFTTATAVKFGGVSATSFTVTDDSDITAVSPPGTGAVDVNVTTATGTSASNASSVYTYGTVPTVTSVSPNNGPAAGGTTVTINGTGFTNLQGVKFGGQWAPIQSSSSTQITVLSPAGSGTVDILVENPFGFSAAVAADQFTYAGNPPPTITAVSPNDGPAVGGTSVTITGTNLTGATAVKFGSSAATSFTVNSATSITAVSPAGAVGTVDVTITTAGGPSATSPADDYQYVAAPTVTGINPTQGSTSGGTIVTITGTNFGGVTGVGVKFGTTAATSYTYNSTTQITATAPPGSGTVDVTIVSIGGVSATSPADRFVYFTPVVPTVTSVTPNAGPASGGTAVTITGSGFTGATAVQFGGILAAYTVNSDTQITATTGVANSGAVDVTVVTAAGTSATSANDQFTFLYAPSVTSVSPNTGPVAGGTSVIITGALFTDVSAVKFGAASATSFTVNSSGQITAVAPAGAAGTVDITVVTPGGASATTALDQFTYAGSAPTVTGLSPASGTAAGGTSVVITGTNFTGATAVNFGAAAATSFTINSATQITAVSPAESASTVDLTVTTSAGTSATSTADHFTYSSTAPPTVTGLNPGNGSTAGGTNVTITGTNFTGATSVKFAATAATTFTVNSATSISATSPAGSGTVDVTVATSAGASATSVADQFTYTSAGGAPAVATINPTGGVAAGGTSVVITGSGFTGATAVKFGTKAATSFTVNSDSQVTVVSPSGSGTVDIAITTSIGTSATVAADKFTYGAAPAVTRVNPTSGPSTGGTTVTVTGSAFTGATEVTFGGVAAESFSVINATTISAVSPPGSGTVDVQVTTPIGTSVARTLDHFTYTAPAPIVSVVNPNSGPTTGGSATTISGSNFTGATAVHFGAVSATTFTVNSDSSISVLPPAAAAAGTVDITVTTSAGTSAVASGDQYTYTAVVPAPTVTAINPTSGPLGGGTGVTITGTNFTGSNLVTFGQTPVQQFTVVSSTEITTTSPGNTTGSVDVVVSTSGGASAKSSADVFTYVSTTPTVTSISPMSGPASGGTVVTVIGANFSGATAVNFGSNAATSFTVNSATQITATAPAGTAGVAPHVTVTTASGTSVTSPADQFSYVGFAPTVTSVNPASGPPAGGTSVIITGSNLVGVSSVMFGANAATSFLVNSNTQITAISPAGSGAIDVTVTNLDGTSPPSAADRYAYATSAPVVTGLNPTSGPGGTSVVVTGSGFTGTTAVVFTGAGAASWTVNSDTQLTAFAPNNGSGTVDVVVSNSAGSSATVAADKFTFTTAPTVTALSPTGGTTAGGTSVTITGTNFTGATAVKFGAASATFTVNNATTITATSPAGSSGAVDVTVTSASGTSVVNPSDQFTYIGAPTVTSVSPTSGPATGGTVVTITGTNFAGATAVKFGSASATFTVNSATSVSATAPAGSAGTIDITVTTASGVSASGTADRYTYTASASPPSVTGVVPNIGSTSGGTSVTISGSGFTGATAVSFAGTAAATFTVNNDSQITATSPAGAAGTVDVTVTTAAGTSAATAADQFTFTSAPAITALTPTFGQTAGGQQIVITGANFTGATAVKFGSTAAQSFQITSPTTIDAIAPVEGLGVVDVTISGPGGTSAIVAADKFTFTGPAPTLSSVTPNSGSIAGGTTVTIIGTSFTNTTVVHFGSVATPSFSFVSDTQITAVSPPGTVGKVDVTVTNLVGTSPANAAVDAFTYVAPTTVSSISPTSGPAAGGTSVTIIGTGFTGATVVKFGVAPATSFTVNSDSQITAVSPAGSGMIDITVTAPVGTSTTSAADQFTYQGSGAAPAVTAVSPTGGPPAGGTSVTITGTGFTGATAVKFEPKTATTFSVVSDTQITAVSPSGSGTVDITVATASGTSATSAADHFTYGAAPAVTRVNPTSGPSTGGTTVTVTGSAFTGATAVTFGGAAAESFSVTNATTISAVSSPGSGTVDVEVTTPVGTSVARTLDHFTYTGAAPAPAVTAISPTSGSTSGGTSVTLTGTNFTGATAVKFGTAAAASFTVNSATSITATSPAGSAGTVDVTVTTPAGTSTTSAADQFTYQPQASPPTVTAISPTSGSTAGGTSVTITGTNFTGATAVKFGTATASFTVNSASSITAISPAGSAGAIDVTVTTSSGTSTTSAADQFTYQAQVSPPTVTAISPTTGSTAGGTSVTITGTNFTGATTVKFGTNSATSFTVNSATLITATSPAGPAGIVDVTVTTSAGTSATGTDDQFTYAAPPPAPTVTAISPTSGSTAGGTSVTITGTNFSGATAVKFGATAAMAFTVNSATQITATSPAGSGGVDVTVTTSAGTSATSAADQFTYVSSGGTPAITAINPTGGATAGGTSVTITGSGFTGATAVTFGTKIATSFTVNSDGQVAAVSPSGSGTVDITITAANGTSATVAADKFTYGVVPTVTRVNPTSGPSTGGTTVTVTGSAFTGATAVTFGGVAAQSFSVTNGTSITAVSPPGAGTVDVEVATPVGTSVARTLDHFTYTGAAPAPTVTAINPTSGSSAGGTSVTITGTNFTGATSVKFGTASATFTVNSATSITATSPAGSVGAVDVTVTISAGTSATSAADQFTYSTSPPPAPTVTAVSPTSGSTAGGASVTVTGTNFTGATSVKFGTATATFTVNSATSVTAASPAGSAGTVDITVTTSGGMSATSAADQFTYTAGSSLPTVTGVSPNSGPTGGGTAVTITGTNFTGANSVLFGNAGVAFTIVNATTITASSPGGSGAVDVTVETSAGTSATTTADHFTYVAPTQLPAITSVVPNAGPASGGNQVTINGSNFSGAMGVKFGTVSTPGFSIVSDSQITVFAPAGQMGTVDVTITTSVGTSATGSADHYTYNTAAALPQITSVSPSSGATGTTVNISGSGFTGATAVSFGGVFANFTVEADGAMQATAPTPALNVTTVDITVTTPAGTSVSTSSDHFTYTNSAPQPTITHVSPATGLTTGGASVIITGTNFNDVTELRFGINNAIFTVNSATQITAISPANSAGTVDIVVVAQGGQNATSAADQFTYLATLTPVVQQVTPPGGPATGGTVVDILGTGFTGATAVSFGSAAGGNLSVISDTEIQVTSPAGSGVVDVKVTGPAGSSAAVAADQFTYAAVPTVSGVSPSGGSAAGGASVMITGTDFTGASGVEFGTTPASFTINSATSITATSPLGTGTVDVRVITPAGVSAPSSSDQYAYSGSEPPVVTSLSPTAAGGPTGGGTSIAINGVNFLGATGVKFGTVAAASFTVNNDGLIIAVSPAAGQAGPVDVTVTTTSGASATSSADIFTYVTGNAAPTVSGLSPTSGAVGASVTITGTNFSGVQQVNFGPIPATSFTVNSATSITATVPPGQGGIVDVIVTAASGFTATTPVDRFTYTGTGPQPTITGVSPSQGDGNGGYPITITGTNLSGAQVVYFGFGGQSGQITSNTATSLTVTAISDVAGMVDLQVATPNGVSAINASDKFTFTQTVPKVTGVSPNSGPIEGLNTVTITGSGFTKATGVFFGSAQANTFTVKSDTTITAAPVSGNGPVDVVVENADGFSAVNPADVYTFTPGPSDPTISSISPDYGPETSPPPVTVTGTNFVNVQKVLWDGLTPAGFTVNSATSLTLSPVGGQPGVHQIQIITATGKSPPFPFTVYPTPTVTNLSPSSGPTTGGGTVVINGSALTGATVVRFGGISVPFTVNGDFAVTAVVPAVSNPGLVDVTVSNPAQTSAFTYLDQYNYTTATTPTVSAVTPNSGPLTGGTPVTLIGSHFTGATSVLFGNEAAANVKVLSDTQLTAVSPSGSVFSTVDVRVVGPGGESVPSAGDGFSYSETPLQPQITAVSPTSGAPTGGTSVTITGLNFTDANAVKFGQNAAASFTVNSATSITAVSPAGNPGVVDISVTTAAGPSALSVSDAFTYATGTPAPVVVSVSPNGGQASGGTVVAIQGDNFSGVTAVKFGGVAATSFTVNNVNLITAVAPASPSGIVDIQVVTAGGASATSTNDQFTYAPSSSSPTVTSINPIHGPAAGGTSVVITGTNLTGATAVHFGTLLAASFTVNSDTQITAVSPPANAALADISVTTPAGTSAVQGQSTFAYDTGTTPVIFSVTPTSGPTAGGTQVSINGANLTSITQVLFGSVAAVGAISHNTDSQLIVTSPAEVAGVVDIKVSGSAGASSTGPSDQYTFVATPTITAVSPTTGSTAGGTKVTITGTAFTGATAVKFGATAAASFTVNSDTQVTATSPAGSAGLVDISVTAPAGTSAAVAADRYTYAASAPTVTGVAPNSGTTAGGTNVVITGTFLTGTSAVKFGTASATSFTVNSDTQITAVSPAGAAGAAVDITVTTPNGTSTAGAPDHFTYSGDPIPTVTGVSPPSGPTNGGNIVTITGTGFTNVSTVKFGANSWLGGSINGAGTVITASVPPGAAGTVDVVVVNDAGSSPVNASDKYTYAVNPAPTVTAVNPSSGPTAGGTSVVITGTSFTSATAVKFGATAATAFTVNSDTQITATAPAGAAGTIDVTVTSANGTSVTSASDHFTYAASGGAPVVTKVNPAGGLPAGGTSVTITGSGFTGATAVKFGTKAATAFTVVSDTQVTAVSPAGTGTVDITVTTSAGVSATSAADQFVYQAAPAVSGISPITGPAAGGTNVTVNGTGFTGATQVMFGTASATSVTVVSATKITAVSPAGTGTVDVLVTTASGTSAARTVDHFTYKASGAIKAATTIRVRVGSGATAQIDLTRGSQANGGKVTMLTPSSAGTAKIVTGAAPGSVSLAFTPAQGFSGQVTVSYALDAASPDLAGATGEVEITVDARPDPSADPGVRGVIQAETDASLRFADAQISNFDQHLESLHADGHGKGGNGVNFNFGFGQDQPNLFAQRDADTGRIDGDQAWPTPALGPDPQAKQPTPSKYPAHAAAAGPGLGNGSGDSPLTVWTGGAISFGQTDAMTLRPGFRFTSDGLSAGVDARVSDELTLGAGAGVGQSYAQVDGGSRVDGHDFVGVLYGDWRPVKSSFIDLIAGWGRLDFTSHRIVSPGVTALGDRSGDDPFVSVTAGWIIDRDGGFKLTPYGRLDEIAGRLDAFDEHGAGTSDLRYDEQSFNSLQGTLGLKGEWRVPTGYGDWTPRFRFEAHHEFDGTGLAGVNYADDLAGPPFTTQADPMRSDSLSAGVGADLHWANKTLNLDYTATSDLVRETVHELRAKLAFKFW